MAASAATSAEVREATEAARERRRRELDRLRIMERVGVMPEHARAELTDFDVAVQRVASAFLGDPSAMGGLVICGPNGTGKTRLAAALVWAFLHERGKTRVLVRTVDELLHELHATPLEERHAYKRKLGGLEVLVLDDLGVRADVTDATVETLHALLSVRNGYGRPTIVTTNRKPEQLKATYGPGIASRLAVLTPLVLDGADRRGVR